MATDIKSRLSTWKSFVSDFRADFDRRIQPTDEYASLSVLVYALQVAVAADTLRSIERESDTPPRDPTEGKTSKLSEDVQLGQIAAQQTNLAMPASLSSKLLFDNLQFQLEAPKILDRINSLDLQNIPLIFGYTYQFWRQTDRKAAQKGIQTADKTIDCDKLIAFTQIYTPDWVVEFILANTVLPVLPQAVSNQSTLSKWRTPTCDTTNDTTHVALDEISILDPSCGTGNFLILAFDALLELKLKTGMMVKESVVQLFEKQLFGCDIDDVALCVTVAALVTRSLRHGITVHCRLNGIAAANSTREPLLGSLSSHFPKTHPLGRYHDIVVTNPPYIGRKLISRELKNLLKKNFKLSHSDLSSAFLEKMLSLLKPGGRAGLITQASVMFLPSFGDLREYILDHHHLVAAVDAGPGVFPFQSGEKVNSAVLVIEKPDPNSTELVTTTNFYNIKDGQEKESLLLAQLGGPSPFAVSPETLRRFHNCAFNYSLPPEAAALLECGTTLRTCAELKQGLATTDNDRFVRFVWQIDKKDLGQVWFPYAKGAGGQRYFSPIRHVVDWQDDGLAIKESVANRYPYLNGKTKWVVKNEAYYFKKGLCFSFVNTSGMAVRQLPKGCIFDVGASAIFSEQLEFLLAYLNSSLVVALANSINPTLNYQVGDLKRLPVVPFTEAVRDWLARQGLDCLETTCQLSSLRDPSAWFHDFAMGNCNAPSPHILYKQVGNLHSLPSVYESIHEEIEKLNGSLLSRRQEIDETVLNHVARSQNWNTATRCSVARWIEESDTERRSSSSQNRRAVLDNILTFKLIEGGVDNFLPNEGNPIRVWLESITGENLSTYINRTLPQSIQKTFFGCPPKGIADDAFKRYCVLI